MGFTDRKRFEELAILDILKSNCRVCKSGDHDELKDLILKKKQRFFVVKNGRQRRGFSGVEISCSTMWWVRNHHSKVNNAGILRDPRTQVWHVLWAMHSSLDELQDLVKALRPKILKPICAVIAHEDSPTNILDRFSHLLAPQSFSNSPQPLDDLALARLIPKEDGVERYNNIPPQTMSYIDEFCTPSPEKAPRMLLCDQPVQVAYSESFGLADIISPGRLLLQGSPHICSPTRFYQGGSDSLTANTRKDAPIIPNSFASTANSSAYSFAEDNPAELPAVKRAPISFASTANSSAYAFADDNPTVLPAVKRARFECGASFLEEREFSVNAASFLEKELIVEDVADRRGINQNESRPKIVVCPGGLGGENYIVDSSDKKVDTESCLVPLSEPEMPRLFSSQSSADPQSPPRQSSQDQSPRLSLQFIEYFAQFASQPSPASTSYTIPSSTVYPIGEPARQVSKSSAFMPSPFPALDPTIPAPVCSAPKALPTINPPSASKNRCSQKRRAPCRIIILSDSQE